MLKSNLIRSETNSNKALLKKQVTQVSSPPEANIFKPETLKQGKTFPRLIPLTLMGQNMVCPNTPLGLIQTPWESFGSDPNKGHNGQAHIHTKDICSLH